VQLIPESVVDEIQTSLGAHTTELVDLVAVWNQGSLTGPVYAAKLFNSRTFTSASVRFKAGIGSKVPSIGFPGLASTHLDKSISHEFEEKKER
jgi:hypothetical protein